MKIDLTHDTRNKGLASIKRYFKETMDETICSAMAEGVLEFFLNELAPTVYNRAVADVQGRLLIRLDDLSHETYADEFQYWSRLDRPSRGALTTA